MQLTHLWVTALHHSVRTVHPDWISLIVEAFKLHMGNTELGHTLYRLSHQAPGRHSVFGRWWTGLYPVGSVLFE